MADEQTQYAGFWRRWAAWTLDAIVIGYIGNAFYFAFLNQLRMRYGLDADAMVLVRVYRAVFTVSVGWAYFAGMESSPLRATLGKLAVGLFVTGWDGARVSFAQAAGRFFGKLLSGRILGLGFMMSGWTARKQGLHDILAGALVCRK